MIKVINGFEYRLIRQALWLANGVSTFLTYLPPTEIPRPPPIQVNTVGLTYTVHPLSILAMRPPLTVTSAITGLKGLHPKVDPPRRNPTPVEVTRENRNSNMATIALVRSPHRPTACNRLHIALLPSTCP